MRAKRGRASALTRPARGFGCAASPVVRLLFSLSFCSFSKQTHVGQLLDQVVVLQQDGACGWVGGRCGRGGLGSVRGRRGRCVPFSRGTLKKRGRRARPPGDRGVLAGPGDTSGGKRHGPGRPGRAGGRRRGRRRPRPRPAAGARRHGGGMPPRQPPIEGAGCAAPLSLPPYSPRGPTVSELLLFHTGAPVHGVGWVSGVRGACVRA